MKVSKVAASIVEHIACQAKVNALRALQSESQEELDALLLSMLRPIRMYHDKIYRQDGNPEILINAYGGTP